MLFPCGDIQLPDSPLNTPEEYINGREPGRWFAALRWLAVLSIIAGSVQAANPWTQVETPASGQPESIGTTNAGCINGATALPLDGPGYLVMRPDRNRRFGHPELVKFVRKLGRQVLEQGIGTLLVGDLSQPRGGPMSSMHRSHQSGLDVDLWFWLPRDIGRRLPSETEREQWHAPSMLDSDNISLQPEHWTEAQVELLRLAAEHPGVDRIFVHPVIKRELCHNQAGSQWLYKLRPWWGHDHHLHVRLRCPPEEPRCVSQQPLPPGDGCDATLAWWFTDEARQQPSKPYEAPDLPAACLALINES
jgi:penicillin-insensitive murein endopeptidase